MTNKEIIVLFFLNEYPNNLLPKQIEEEIHLNLEKEGYIGHRVRMGGVPLYQLTEKGKEAINTINDNESYKKDLSTYEDQLKTKQEELSALITVYKEKVGTKSERELAEEWWEQISELDKCEEMEKKYYLHGHDQGVNINDIIYMYKEEIRNI